MMPLTYTELVLRVGRTRGVATDAIKGINEDVKEKDGTTPNTAKLPSDRENANIEERTTLWEQSIDYAIWCGTTDKKDNATWMTNEMFKVVAELLLVIQRSMAGGLCIELYRQMLTMFYLPSYKTHYPMLINSLWKTSIKYIHWTVPFY